MSMMEKPRPKAAAEPAKKKSAEEAVEELEKRLAALGGPSPDVAPEEEAPAPEVDLLNMSAPEEPAPPVAAGVKGGKNALLVCKIYYTRNKQNMSLSWACI